MKRARRGRLVRLWITVALLCVSFGSAAFAQNPRGTLRGSVQDTSCGRVAGARIVLDNEQLSITRETQSDLRGEFRIEELPPSSYVLTVNATGFTVARSDVVVAVSRVGRRLQLRRFRPR